MTTYEITHYNALSGTENYGEKHIPAVCRTYAEAIAKLNSLYSFLAVAPGITKLVFNCYTRVLEWEKEGRTHIMVIIPKED